MRTTMCQLMGAFAPIRLKTCSEQTILLKPLVHASWRRCHLPRGGPAFHSRVVSSAWREHCQGSREESRESFAQFLANGAKAPEPDDVLSNSESRLVMRI